MKLDYKSPLKNFSLRSMVSRQTVHLILSTIAVICLTIAIFPRHTENKNVSNAATTAEELVTPIEPTIVIVADNKDLKGKNTKVQDLKNVSLQKSEQNQVKSEQKTVEPSSGTAANENPSNAKAVHEKTSKQNSFELSSSSKSKEIADKEPVKAVNKEPSENIKEQKSSEQKTNTNANTLDKDKNQAKNIDPKTNKSKIYEKPNTDLLSSNDSLSNKETQLLSKLTNKNLPNANNSSNPNNPNLSNPASQTINKMVNNSTNIITKNSLNANWQTIKIQKNDTLAKIFSRHGFSNKDLQEILALSKAKTHLKTLQNGQNLKLQVVSNNRVEGLSLDLEPGNTLMIARNETGQGFKASQKQIPLEKKMAFGKGEIRASLIGAAKRSGIDNNIVTQLLDIYGSSIDFSSELRQHDTFRVLYEQKCLPDGERVKTGPVLAAEITKGGKKIQAIRYTDKSGHTGYFSPEGQGLNQAFLRSPVNFASVSSGFGMRRHPIFHKMKKHVGVDFAAPHGTPVLATSDAKVIFVGNKSGYGKTIELQHGPRYSTLYAHLSRYAKGLKSGKDVKKGDVIGYVGKTGLATNNHLHYEFRVDGIHRDPLTVTLPKTKLIPDTNKKHFLAHAKEMLRLMDIHDQKVHVASVEFTLND